MVSCMTTGKNVSFDSPYVWSSSTDWRRERWLAYKRIPSLCDMLQGMDDGHFQSRGRGCTAGKILKEPTCECTRPNTKVHCNVCGYVTVGRIRKQCPLHPMVSVFTTGFPLLGRFAKLRKATNALVASVCRVRPRETTWLPLGGFSRKFIFQYFSKICRKIVSRFKIWQEKLVLYMKTYIYIYTVCFTTLRHNCRRWFPRSLWSKKFI